MVDHFFKVIFFALFLLSAKTKLQDFFETRMHSSRMCITRFDGSVWFCFVLFCICGPITPPVTPTYLSATHPVTHPHTYTHAWIHTPPKCMLGYSPPPPSHCRQTGACENITFLQLRLRVVNIPQWVLKDQPSLGLLFQNSRIPFYWRESESDISSRWVP